MNTEQSDQIEIRGNHNGAQCAKCAPCVPLTEFVWLATARTHLPSLKSEQKKGGHGIFIFIWQSSSSKI